MDQDQQQTAQSTSPTQTAQPQPSVAPQPKPKRSWLMYAGISIIVLIFLGSFGFGLYVLRQRNTKTPVAQKQDSSVSASSQSVQINQMSATVDVSSWKTLESKYCGLTLKYPAEFTVKEGEFSCGISIGDNKINYGFLLLGQSVKQSMKDASSSADSYLAAYRSQNSGNITEVTINGMKGYENVVDAANGLETVKIAFGTGTTVYLVSGFYQKTNPDAKALTENIVSTIQQSGNPEETIKPPDSIDKVARSFSQANNTKRRSDINAILNAVHQYAADNRGILPAGITTDAKEISFQGANICSVIVPTYIAAIPTDPLNDLAGKNVIDCSSSYSSGYMILKGSDNKVNVFAPGSELGETISVTR